MDKIKALNTKVMAKDFGRVGLGTLAIVAGAFLWGKFLYGRGVRGCQRWMCETFPDEYESMTEKVADMLEQDHLTGQNRLSRSRGGSFFCLRRLYF